MKTSTSGLVARIDEGLRRLQAIAKLDARTLARSYGPGKWNGVEILAHLGDADLVYYTRFLKVIAEPGVPIVPFDENVWTRELRARERPVGVSIAACAAARAGLVHHLETLPRTSSSARPCTPRAGR